MAQLRAASRFGSGKCAALRPQQRRRGNTCLRATAAGETRKQKEAHKVFDEAKILCRSGRGGRGELVEAGKGRWVDNFKYQQNSGLKKKIWLPASEPANGEDGGDVYLEVDPSVGTLLHLQEERIWTARSGSNGNPLDGSGAPKRAVREQRKAQSLLVPVPLGTVVRDKNGRKLAELVRAGDSYCVCEGGLGGRGVVVPSREARARRQEQQQRRRRRKEGDLEVEIVEVEDTNWKHDALGGPHTSVKVQLQLRVVADAGFVGLPNVGKTSLLRCMTRARAAVADYPFTTLMPNLGVMSVGPSGAGGDREDAGKGGGASVDALNTGQQVLVDLPGLIEGAHVGRGLGRMFLRHISRTRVLVHVVDASADDPAGDLEVIREELRMYNPEYCSRPYLVVLNKMDLPDAAQLKDEVVGDVGRLLERLSRDAPDVHVPAAAVHCCSALTGTGISELVGLIHELLLREEHREELLIDDEDSIDDWALPTSDPRFPRGDIEAAASKSARV